MTRIITIILFAAALFGQTRDTYPRTLGAYTVATLPSPAANSIAIVTDGASASDCTVGGGSTRALCAYSGSAWVSIGGSGSGASAISDLTDCKATYSGGTLTAAACSARNGSLDVSAASCTVSLSGTSASGTAYAYLSGDGTFTIGHATAATLTCTGRTIATGISAFPDDAIPLFTATFSSNAWNSGGITIYRRMISRDPYSTGDGITSSNNPSTGITTLQVDSAQIPRYFAASGVPTQNCTQGRDFYLNTATSTLYQCTSTNTWASIGGASITVRRYSPWGFLALNSSNQTTAFSANETRWHQFHLTSGMTITGVGIRASTGLGASKGLRFAIADTSGTISNKTAVNTTCSSNTLCQAAFTSPITLSAGVYYVGITTDSTSLNTYQSNAFIDGTVICGLSDAGSTPYVAGTGTAGSGTAGSVDFGASMGTLTTYACNSGSNVLVTKFHDVYFY